MPLLEQLYKRALENGCKITLIDGSKIPDYEPNCKGLKAIVSPNTGIIDYGVFTRSLVKDFRNHGGESMTNFQVTAFKDTNSVLNSDKANDYPVTVVGKEGEMVHGRWAVTCCGLQSDRVAQMTGCSPYPKIVPFRGEYLILKPERKDLVKTNIYPVPEPGLPFLGVHFTPRMDGNVWLGPNAVLALSREKYARWPLDFEFGDVLDYSTFGGLYKLGMKHFKFGVQESLRSLSSSSQVKELQRFVPSLRQSDVVKGPVGVRAQAVDSNGAMVDDFLFDKGTNPGISSLVLHVRNAPSPAATSSLAIAEMITDRVSSEFGLKKLYPD